MSCPWIFGSPFDHYMYRGVRKFFTYFLSTFLSHNIGDNLLFHLPNQPLGILLLKFQHGRSGFDPLFNCVYMLGRRNVFRHGAADPFYSLAHIFGGHNIHLEEIKLPRQNRSNSLVHNAEQQAHQYYQPLCSRLSGSYPLAPFGTLPIFPVNFFESQ